VSDVLGLFLALLALLSRVVAWRQWREVVIRRHVDMFWRIFAAVLVAPLPDGSGLFDQRDLRRALGGWETRVAIQVPKREEAPR
jgi:hypothetical protein